MSQSNVLKIAVVLSVLALPQVASAADSTVPFNTTEACNRAVADTLESRKVHATVGEKARKVFRDLVRLAKKRCASEEYAHANELMVTARSMVATD